MIFGHTTICGRPAPGDLCTSNGGQLISDHSSTILFDRTRRSVETPSARRVAHRWNQPGRWLRSTGALPTDRHLIQTTSSEEAAHRCSGEASARPNSRPQNRRCRQTIRLLTLFFYLEQITNLLSMFFFKEENHRLHSPVILIAILAHSAKKTHSASTCT